MYNHVIEEPQSCYNLTQLSALIHGGSTDPGETLFFFPVECFRVSDPLFSVLRALRMLGPLQARIPLAASIASSHLYCYAAQLQSVQSLFKIKSDLSQAPVLGSQRSARPRPGTRPRLHCLHRHPSGSHQLHCLVLRGFPVLVQVLPLLRLLSP